MEFVMEHPVFTAVAVVWCSAALVIGSTLLWSWLTYRSVMRELFRYEDDREEE